MARPEKVAVVEEIQQKLDDADAAVLTEYRGLSVGELAELRAALRPASTEYKVFKNSLARRAVEAAGRDDLVDLLEGPVAFAFVRGDAAAAAKAIDDFAGDHEALVVKGGLLDGKLLEPADIKALAKLPTRDVMLGTIAGAMKAPLTKAAGLFGSFPREMAQLTQALVDKRVAAGEEAPPGDTPTEETSTGETSTGETSAGETSTDEAPASDTEAEAPAGEDATGEDAAPEADTESETDTDPSDSTEE